MAPIGRVWSALDAGDCNPRGPDHKFVALCPAHEDRNPSLSVGEARDGKVLIFCHAGCSVEAVLDALALGWQDIFPEDRD